MPITSILLRIHSPICSRTSLPSTTSASSGSCFPEFTDFISTTRALIKAPNNLTVSRINSPPSPSPSASTRRCPTSSALSSTTCTRYPLSSSFFISCAPDFQFPLISTFYFYALHSTGEATGLTWMSRLSNLNNTQRHDPSLSLHTAFTTLLIDNGKAKGTVTDCWA